MVFPAFLLSYVDHSQHCHTHAGMHTHLYLMHMLSHACMYAYMYMHNYIYKLLTCASETHNFVVCMWYMYIVRSCLLILHMSEGHTHKGI